MAGFSAASPNSASGWNGARWVEMIKSSAIYLAIMAIASAKPALPPSSAAGEVQLLCAASTAFIGKVVHARAADCRLFDADTACYRSGDIGTVVRVEEILDPSQGEIHKGDFVHASSTVANFAPVVVGKMRTARNISERGAIGFPATGKPVTDEEATQGLLHQRFIFNAVDPHPISASTVSQPLAVRMWMPGEAQRFRRLWSSAECQRWKRS